MAKDRLTIILGVIYISLIISAWIFLFFPFDYYDNYHIIHQGIYMLTQYGFWGSFFGSLFLIPSLILNLIFIKSTEGTASGIVGFGLGIPGWVGNFVGCLFGFGGATAGSRFVPLSLLIITICLIIFGSLLFTRYRTVSKPSTIGTQGPPLPAEALGPPCPQCNHATRFIPQHNRHYCDHCQKYI